MCVCVISFISCSFGSDYVFTPVSPSHAQVMVFSNLFKFQPVAEELHGILTQLMEDENVEVLPL